MKEDGLFYRVLQRESSPNRTRGELAALQGVGNTAGLSAVTETLQANVARANEVHSN